MVKFQYFSIKFRVSNYRIKYLGRIFGFSSAGIVLNPSKSIPKRTARKALQKGCYNFFRKKKFFGVNLADNPNFFEKFSSGEIFLSHLISCSDWCQICIKTIISAINTDFKGKIKYCALIGWDKTMAAQIVACNCFYSFFSQLIENLLLYKST